MDKLGRCINCDIEATNMHHVVPKVLGGNEGSNLVPLCGFCHDKVHNTDHLSLKELQRVGIERSKKEGKYKGRPPTIDRSEITSAISQGLGATEISKKLKISRQSVYRIGHNGDPLVHKAVPKEVPDV